ncbi:class II fumarate hydratase [Shouchella lonarensis]|uniref:Fumarate hydratase class II n=1 Tax=Shouchella lonarensis TaxID=1464122 RepID=A0A1G6IW33_9BACI|nr:class II fumarate hydratase [Shouchella lonarensis]SDC10621.1 fumarase, class II [Shouchella lonarensis]
MKTRTETDTIGPIEVPADRFWGAQTQRSLENFKIGTEKMPIAVVRAFAELKKATAIANGQLKDMDARKVTAITYAADQVIAGKLDDHFPLVVWQTGSGTQSNMNMNEVLAYIANDYLDEQGHEDVRVHPNDDVNASQSSNDTFPTAMHIATVVYAEHDLLPALQQFEATLAKKEADFKDVVKIGRTHLQDATPLTFGQELSGFRHMLATCTKMVRESLHYVRALTIGGTAVGTGLNAPIGFGAAVCEQLSKQTGVTFQPSENYFHGLTSHDELTHFHGALKALAADVFKIANDIRLLASGPRCGIGEVTIPANEPGSSIMPGKVNPTQSEALTMVAAQVLGNDATIGFAASQGHFQLNVFKPVIIYNVLQSMRLLADGLNNFHDKCLIGLEADEEKMNQYLGDSLMLVTALNPHIGYENAAHIAKKAHAEKTTLKAAAIASGLLTEEQFDQYVVPKNMIASK